jgi:hypothetical protein
MPWCRKLTQDSAVHRYEVGAERNGKTGQQEIGDQQGSSGSVSLTRNMGSQRLGSRSQSCGEWGQYSPPNLKANEVV